MKDHLLEFKREFGVVNEFQIYNTELKHFEHSESQNIQKHVIEMHQLGCLESLEYSFLTIEDQEYLLYKGEKLIAVLSFDEDAVYNKVLLTHKIKRLIKNLE